MPATHDIAQDPKLAALPRKGERTAERILEAAEKRFAERGYEGTTLRDVASAVGLRIPSLYNHFPGKQALYAAVLERGISPVLAALSEFVEASDETPQASTRVVARMMELLAARPNLPKLIQQELLHGGEQLTPILRGWIRPIFRRARQAIESNPAASRWDPDQVPLLVLALYHVMVGYFTVAPLYKSLNGEDLLAKPALARQTRFCSDLVSVLLSNEKP